MDANTFDLSKENFRGIFWSNTLVERLCFNRMLVTITMVPDSSHEIEAKSRQVNQLTEHRNGIKDDARKKKKKTLIKPNSAKCQPEPFLNAAITVIIWETPFLKSKFKLRVYESVAANYTCFDFIVMYIFFSTDPVCVSPGVFSQCIAK